MNDRRLERLFGAMPDDHAAPGRGMGARSDCPSPEALLDLVAPASPAAPALLRHVAGCEACAAGVRMLIESAGEDAGTLPNTGAAADGADRVTAPAAGSDRDASRSVRRIGWLVAAAAGLLAALGIWFFRDAGVTLADRAVVVAVDGVVRAGERALVAGETVAAGARLTFEPGSRVTVADRSGALRIFTADSADAAGARDVAFRDHVVRELVAAVGRAGGDPDARRTRVRELPDAPRMRPMISTRHPRGAIRGVRPAFRFSAPDIGPGEELILRVRHEQGDVVLEVRFAGGETEVGFPADSPALNRGQSYAWSIFHPRSGPGRLGSESFRVVDEETLEKARAVDERFAALRGRFPVWFVALLRAAKYRSLDLDAEALEALPVTVPDGPLRGFALEERALLYHRLGYDERIAGIKAELRALEADAARGK